MLDYLRQFLRRILGFSSEEDLTTPPNTKSDVAKDPSTDEKKSTSPDSPKPTPAETAPKVKEEKIETQSSTTPQDASELPSTYQENLLSPLVTDGIRALSFHRSAGTSPSRYLWCIDNGHGSLQAGKRSPVWGDGTQLLEWEFNRKVVQLILKKLDTHGISYFEVVPEKDVDAFLKERVQRANLQETAGDTSKIYVSVHGNSAQDSGVQGVETWYHTHSTSGKRIASVFQKHLMQGLQASSYRGADRGIRQITPANKSFYVLHYTAMPAIVTENGFYSNEEECRLMLTSEFQEMVAQAHVEAILEIESNGYDNQPIYHPNTEIRL